MVIVEIVVDLRYTIFIAMVLVIALSSAMLGIELFKDALINYDEIRILNPDFDKVSYTWYDILINSISLAFLADNTVIEEFTTLTDFLKYDDIENHPELKLNLERLSVFYYLIQILFIVVIFFYIIILLNFVIAVMSDT